MKAQVGAVCRQMLQCFSVTGNSEAASKENDTDLSLLLARLAQKNVLCWGMASTTMLSEVSFPFGLGKGNALFLRFLHLLPWGEEWAYFSISLTEGKDLPLLCYKNHGLLSNSVSTFCKHLPGLLVRWMSCQTNRTGISCLIYCSKPSPLCMNACKKTGGGKKICMYYIALIRGLLPGVPADSIHNSIVEQDCMETLKWPLRKLLLLRKKTWEKRQENVCFALRERWSCWFPSSDPKPQS